MSLLFNLLSKNFTPKRVKGLQLWLDAFDNSTITESGGAVSQWDDKSGNGNNATQGTGLQQPILTVSGIGGRPSITFDGSSSNLSIADSASISLTGDCTFFAVMNSTANAADQNFLAKDQNASYRWRIDANNDVFSLVNSGGGLETDTSTSGITRDTNTIVGILVDMGADTSFFINGVAVGTPNLTTTSIADTSGLLIVGANSPSSETFNGDIAEILVYSRLLSSAERISVETYLSNKWGIAI